MNEINERLLTVCVRLHEALSAANLTLAMPEVTAAAAERDAVATQLADYVIPRLLEAEAPLLAVVGGSTGAGKSTLVNSIVGASVTEAGVLRPTTRSPVLVHNPADAAWFVQTRILPDFRRTERSSADPGQLQLVSSMNVPQGIAVLDAPDVDSLEERNRTLASQLLDAADMWLFVTSAARYADQVPWDYLRRAADRKAAVAIVLDRTPTGAVAEVSGHLSRMLISRGLKDSPLFMVPEGSLNGGGLLSQGSIEQIQVWLEQLAADDYTRAAVIRQTLAGTVRTIAKRAHDIADACERSEDVSTELRAALVADYSLALDAIEQTLTLGRGGDALAGSGEALVTGCDQIVLAILEDHMERAAVAVYQRWCTDEVGRKTLKAAPDLGHASRDLRGWALGLLGAWRLKLREVVSAKQPAHADGKACHQDLVIALQVAILSNADSAGPAVLAQREMLERIYGLTETQQLIAEARAALMIQLEDAVTSEAQRFESMLGARGSHRADAEVLRTMARELDDLRLRKEDWL